MKTFLKINYKGKYFVIQDKIIEPACDYSIGEISKKNAMKQEFVDEHKAHCRYYGIPTYIGDDKDLNKIYK